MDEPSESTLKEDKPPIPAPRERDFLLHLESYLARRDGVDKLLKISRYAAKIALASPSRGGALSAQLKSFESSVGLSRKAFRLGKFIQDLNSLRFFSASKTLCSSPLDLFLAIVAYGGEGLYFFIEQFIWLARSGLLPAEIAPPLQKISTWAELIGYFGSVALKTREMKKIEAMIEAQADEDEEDEEMEMERLRSKLELKRLSIVQDVADGVMAFSDVRQNKGFMTSPLLLASAGLLSALISTHRNWRAC